MKTVSISLAAAAGLLLTVAGIRILTPEAKAQAPAAAAAPKIKKLADINKVNVDVQKTPQFTVQYTKDKRSVPKDWLEMEVDLKMERDKEQKDPKVKTYPQVTFKYYAYLSGNPDPAKNRIITGEVVHVNVPIDEATHSVMYISPATILGVTEGKPVNPTMIKAWGVQAFIGGDEVGRKTSEAGNKEWWKGGDGQKLPPQENAFLTKKNTPFAPLWFDYHLEEQTK